MIKEGCDRIIELSLPKKNSNRLNDMREELSRQMKNDT